MTKTPSPWPHRFAIGLSFCTLFLIFAGGLVNSMDAGLSVPDWPLSYGKLMPPMIGGVFYEHGHRMIATFVGFLTIIMALLLQFKSDSPFLKKMGWLALLMVILQGIVGGLTVLLLLPPAVSIVHACMAQTFFSLVVALAVWTSSFWKNPPAFQDEKEGSMSLSSLAATFFAVAYGQLILGAVLRHSGWGVSLHIIGGITLLFLSIVLYRASRRAPAPFRRTGLLLMISVIVQISLGLTSYFLLGYEFSVIPIPMYAIVIITSHVVTGAFILGLSVVMGLMSYRVKAKEPKPAGPTKLADYFELTKPGITFTAGITALAGFILGSKGDINVLQLVHTGIGTLLISAGACALNMLVEKDIDAQMKRTRKRPLPSGRIQPGEVLFLSILLSTVALVYLASQVNFLTAFIAGFTLGLYVYIYTPLKKITSLCTGVGAVAGALPPVMGWTAATGSLGWEALVLFGILFFWQFPHFFSLAWLYKDDYQRAGLHMLPRIEDKGQTTAISMLGNSIALLIVSIIPTLMGLTGYIYLAAAIFLGVWLTVASFHFYKDRSVAQARKLFFASLAYVPVLVLAMVIKI